MINANHQALMRYALLMGFIGLLLVPLLVALFSDIRFPPDRGETVNVPRHMNNAAHIAFNLYDEDPRIVVHLPNDGETYLGRDHLTDEDLTEGLKKLKAARPADAGIVYLKAGVAVSHGNFVETLQRIRSAGIDRVGLMVRKDKGDGSNEEAGFLEVKLQTEVAQGKQGAEVDPLMLVVRIESDGKVRLNSELTGNFSDSKELASWLATIFRLRETMPEPVHEKEVFVSASVSTKYDSVVRLIDLISGTGARPIIIQLDRDLPRRLPSPRPASDKLSLRP